MTSTVLRSGLAGLLLIAAGSAQAGSPPPSKPDNSTFFQRLSTDLKGPDQTGQPGAECGSDEAPNRPGHAQDAPGSAFNPDGKAGTVYAGEQPQNSKNSASVSQYDAACASISNKGH